MGESPVRVGAEVGRVAGLWRYPVKSMAPDPVPSAEVSWHGVTGDRRWAFMQERREASGFPWLTIRDCADMVRYRPRFVEPEKPNTSPVVVTTPTGEVLDVTDRALAAELGDGVRAVKLDRGTFDTLPLSLITTQSVASLGRLVGRALDVRRFRPNVLIDAHNADTFPEENWTSCTLRIGDALVRVDARDQRCIVVNVDPTTVQRDPIVFRTIGRRRQARLAVYATTAQPGCVAVGDAVVIVASWPGAVTLSGPRRGTGP